MGTVRMKKVRIEKLLFVGLIFLSLSFAPTPYERVKFVYDGDTILLENGVRVRYLGMNAPELDHHGGKSEAMAHDAWKANQRLVADARVRLEQTREKQDQYGRCLAFVFLNDGRMVNNLMVERGMAHVSVYSKGLKYRKLLLESQRNAMTEKKGIWKKLLKNHGGICLGNSRSFRFHDMTCSFGGKISKKSQKRFRSRRDAFWEGYSPCKQCRP